MTSLREAFGTAVGDDCVTLSDGRDWCSNGQYCLGANRTANPIKPGTCKTCPKNYWCSQGKMTACATGQSSSEGSSWCSPIKETFRCCYK